MKKFLNILQIFNFFLKIFRKKKSSYFSLKKKTTYFKTNSQKIIFNKNLAYCFISKKLFFLQILNNRKLFLTTIPNIS